MQGNLAMGLLPMNADILPPSDDRVLSISQDERERAVFRSRRMYQTDLQSDLATAEDRGRVAERTERNIEIARNMILDGDSIEKIIRYTGLSGDEIASLRTTS